MRILIDIDNMYTLIFAIRIARYHKKNINGLKIITSNEEYVVHISPRFSDDDFKGLCNDVLESGYINLTDCITFIKLSNGELI